ncbi:MAG: hypothetical protein K2N47_00200, partial [Clostridia bacterium]|nr:hypothetical protein [Clostridia bacterium]
TALYDMAKDAHKTGALDLANAVYPRDLDEGEGYVAFNYDEKAFALSKGALIPMYIGDLADFNAASYVASYPYAVHRDINNVSDLDWAYKNSNGYIVGNIVGENNLQFGGALTSSVTFNFSTQKIYRVTVRGGNDEMYDVTEKQPQFCKDSGFTFRYLAEGNAENFLSGLTPRKGFDLSWEYLDGYSYKPLTSLETALRRTEGHDLTISPKWELRAPVITYARTDAENNTIVYGQDVSFSAEATIEAEGVNLEYGWYYVGNKTHFWDDTQSFKLENDELVGGKPDVTQAGDYHLTVIATGGATSLTRSAAAIVHLTIDPKPVSFEWEVTENGTPIDGEVVHNAIQVVYNGVQKVVKANFDSSQWVNGESYVLIMSFRDASGTATGGNTYSVVNAGSYTFTVALAKVYDGLVSMFDEPSDKYVYEDTSTLKLTVQQATVTATWSGYENLTYNGGNQCPTATCTGYYTDGEIIQRVDGAAKNAGTHTATAVLNNNNYKLTNPTQPFVIDKAPLTVKPKAVTVTYGDKPVGNGYDCIGLLGGDIASAAVRGNPTYNLNKYKDARDTAYPDGVEISGLTSNNYEITYEAGSLKIDRRTVTLVWGGNTNLVYNAEAKNITATIINKVAGDDLGVTVTGGNEINAGEHTATATLTGESAGNYRLPANTMIYIITRARVIIYADDKTSVEGQPTEELTATVVGTIYNNGEVTYTLQKEEGETAGTYAITVTFTENDNYVVETVNGTYTITAAPEEEN